MKKSLLSLIIALIIIISCNEQKKEINHSNLLGKHIKNEIVQEFLKKLGSDYDYEDTYGQKFYNYNNKGVELNFTKSDTLSAIFFNIDKLSPDIELPLNIKPTDSRKEIVEKFGEPDKYFVGLNNLIAFYLKNDLVIKFKSKDTTNINNGLENVSIQKLDRQKILGIQ